MAKLELRTVSKSHKTSGRLVHYVELVVDGVIFETKCEGFDTACDLVLRMSRTLGIAYKKDKS